ncbi:hypothetical protein IW261DRAFT_894345 [Armillaria novae-zelandiae]|uniref:Uncharacterized protein n=1 Tax=Armillaria novae-zelandiae TaxID=153914 RepID=A0AA39TVQ4_9AGAR|nr:hypothetical protein IW261DRAFT_894345 [Armillaria novae-zelandiae]
MDKSSKESEVDALHWLYERSSTLAIRRLIIQALAGLPPDDISRAEEVFHPHWDEMQEEKERMLMDCVQLSRDGFTRWIPKDIPNIGSRIEPLLRLEILFPSLRRKYPSRVFGEHDLDFSRKLSNTLSMTLSAIDDAHIQKPVGQNQLIMDVFADNSVHHPLIWERLLGRYVDKENLINTIGEDGFTIGMCLNLVTSIYPSEDSSPGTDNFTLAYPLITSHKNEILRRLLTFFPTSESDNITVDLEHSLSLAIFRSLVPDLALSIINSHQPHRFCRDSIFSKYQLLHVALRAIKQAMFSVVDHPSKEWRTHLFWAILSYIKSDLFSGHALTNSEYWEFKDPFWACRAYALVCMGLLIGGSAEDRVIEWNKEWANKDLFTNILLVINDEHAADAPFLHPVREITGDSRHPVDSISGVVGWLFGQAFKQGIPGAYEAFQESGSLGYIAEKRNLHPELIEGLCGYITGLSSGKAGRLPDIQLNELINRHIDDLHQVPVIRCICASLARSETPEHPILSTLASIAPYHNEWSNILQILNSPDHKYSVQCYTLRFADMRTREDAYYLQRDMKRGVSVLADCLESQKCRNRNNDQLSANSDHLARGQETHHRSGSTTDPDTDVELGLLSSQNVDVT